MTYPSSPDRVFSSWASSSFLFLSISPPSELQYTHLHPHPQHHTPHLRHSALPPAITTKMVLLEIAAILGVCLLYRRHKDKKRARAAAAAGYANQYQHYENQQSYPPNYHPNHPYPPPISKDRQTNFHGGGYATDNVHGAPAGSYRGEVYAQAIPQGNPPAYSDSGYPYQENIGRREVKGRY